MYLVLADIALLIPAFSLLLPPPVLAIWLLWRRERSPTNTVLAVFHGFGTMLEPRYVVGAIALDQ